MQKINFCSWAIKELLNSSTTTNSLKILIAELIKVNLSPFSNKLIINKGKENNLYLGQVAIDNLGLLGQVSETNDFHLAVFSVQQS